MLIRLPVSVLCSAVIRSLPGWQRQMVFVRVTLLGFGVLGLVIMKLLPGSIVIVALKCESLVGLGTITRVVVATLVVSVTVSVV